MPAPNFSPTISGFHPDLPNLSTQHRPPGTLPGTVCAAGSLANTITNHIKSNPVELLVIGNMGSTGILSLFKSYASLIVEKIKTPTLIISLESKFSKNSVIPFATDFSSEGVEALEALIEAFAPEKLNVLNVNEGTDPNGNEMGEKALKDLIKNTEMEFTCISKSNPLDGIVNL